MFEASDILGTCARVKSDDGWTKPEVESSTISSSDELYRPQISRRLQCFSLHKIMDICFSYKLVVL